MERAPEDESSEALSPLSMNNGSRLFLDEDVRLELRTVPMATLLSPVFRMVALLRTSGCEPEQGGIQTPSGST